MSLVDPPHLRASAATASAEAAASAATSAAATAAAAALFKVASNLWMADASAVGPLVLPEGGKFHHISLETHTRQKKDGCGWEFSPMCTL